jgi:hypothetical protein
MRFAARAAEYVGSGRRHGRQACGIRAARRLGVIGLVILPMLAALAETASGAEWELAGAGFSLLRPGERLSLDHGDLSRFAQTQPPSAPTAAALTATAERQPNWLLTSIIAGGAVTGAALNSLLEGNHQRYHFVDEGWFGRDTHYGGADKASHFTMYYILSKEFSKLFTVVGHRPEHARWLAAGTAALTGLVNEIGDGTTRYGFSYEDLVMDVGGALTAALVDLTSTEDLIGFRRGFVTFRDCCDYSNEIYTADFQLAGAARRLGLNIGPLKYLLLSATYGTKGYPGESGTERQVGFEIGLNFKQILDNLNVRRDKWWGYALHVAFDNFRLPYTAVGFRYDMNHGRWRGPNAGD